MDRLLWWAAIAASAAIMVFFLLWILSYSVLAADPSERRDPLRGEWFKSLRTNPDMRGNSYSCCDISDCQAVEATQLDGSWWIKVGDAVIPVPDDRVVTNPATIDGDAYACLMAPPGFEGSLVRCFIPPSPGY